jgi:hypothetical protein
MIRNRNNHDEASFPDAIGRSRYARGLVQRVDTVQRELTILMDNGLEVFDIPTDCPIFLHGERVKLRMIQPRDHVRIRFAKGDEIPTARSVEVQPDTGFSCFRL